MARPLGPSQALACSVDVTVGRSATGDVLTEIEIDRPRDRVAPKSFNYERDIPRPQTNRDSAAINQKTMALVCPPALPQVPVPSVPRPHKPIS